MKQPPEKKEPGTAFENALKQTSYGSYGVYRLPPKTETEQEAAKKAAAKKAAEAKKVKKAAEAKKGGALPSGVLNSADPQNPQQPRSGATTGAASKNTGALKGADASKGIWNFGLTEPVNTSTPPKNEKDPFAWDYKLGTPVKKEEPAGKAAKAKTQKEGLYWEGGLQDPVLFGDDAKKAAGKKTAADKKVDKWEEFRQRELKDLQKHYPGLKFRPPEGMSPDFYKWATQTKKMTPEEAVELYKRKSSGDLLIEPEADDSGVMRFAKGAANVTAPVLETAAKTVGAYAQEVPWQVMNWGARTAEDFAKYREERVDSPDRLINILGEDADEALASVGIYSQADGTYKDEAGKVFSGKWEAMFEGAQRGLGGESPKPVIPEIYDAGKAWMEYTDPSPEGQTIATSGAKTEEEAGEAVDATNSEVAAPPSAQQEQEKNDNKPQDGKSTSEAAVDGGETASGDENPNAGDKVRQEGGSEEDALKADYVEYNVPKGMMTEPLRKQLNTMPPATEAETGFFESPAFQTSLLTFGLAMLMGKDSNDALRIAGNAYYQENYKTTGEYKELKKYSVPDSVIYQAVATDDWTEVQKWYDTGKKAFDEAEKKRIEAMNPYKDLGSTQEVVLKDLLQQNKTLTKSMEDIWMAGNMAEQYRHALDTGGNLNQLDGLLMMNVMQRFIDPNATVRGEDVTLIEARKSIPQWARNMYHKFFGHLEPGDEAGFKAAFNSMSPGEMNDMVTLIEKGVATQMQAARRELEGYSASAYNAGIDTQWHSWNQGRFATYMTPYEKDQLLFEEKKKKQNK